MQCRVALDAASHRGGGGGGGGVFPFDPPWRLAREMPGDSALFARCQEKIAALAASLPSADISSDGSVR